MEIATAKEYFHLGLLSGARVRAPFVLHAGWTVEFSGTLGNADPLLRTARRAVREFASADSALSVCRDIGLRSVAVDL